mgnify:FL=1
MFINFANTFLSYLLLVIVIVIVVGVAIFIGITLAKKNNQKKSMENTENITKDEQSDV